jgi:hypothetical protein
VNASGALTGSATYDAWGNPLASGGLTSTTPFGYAGSYSDMTGLDYLIKNTEKYPEPHLRASHGGEAVGAKPWVACVRYAQEIIVYVQMWKVHFYGLLQEKVGPVWEQSSGLGEWHKFQIKNVAVRCTSTKKTTWLAESWGDALENGQWYSSKNPPGKPIWTPGRSLECGTQHDHEGRDVGIK